MKPGKTPRLRGVALILTSPTGEILTLEEFKTKIRIGKRAGMRSIPMETSQPGESDESAIKRLMAEELPGIEGQIFGPISRVGKYQVIPNVWATLYKGTVANATLPSGIGKEVGNYKWINAEEALHFWLRKGAREMIVDFQKGSKGVVRHMCQDPSPFPPLS